MSYPKSYNTLHATHLSAADSSLQNVSVGGVFQLTGVQVQCPVSDDLVYVSGQGSIIAPKSTLGSLTLCMPKNPCHGQVLYLSFTQSIKNISYKSLVSFAHKSQLSSAQAGDNIVIMYDQNLNKWLKLSGSDCACTPSSCCEPVADAVADAVVDEAVVDDVVV
jgi:hypothetical protein